MICVAIAAQIIQDLRRGRAALGTGVVHRGSGYPQIRADGSIAGAVVVSVAAVTDRSVPKLSTRPAAPDEPGPTQRPTWSTRLALAGLDPGRPGVRALAILVVVVAVAAALLAWRLRPRVEPVAPSAPVAPASAPGPSGSAGPGGPVVVVAVSGLVRTPGLVRLPTGSRVADAIAAAGGVLPGTDLSLVNLARRVSDGELIVIGLPGAMASAGPDGGGGGPVNLNTATLEQLQTLPGVGPVLAQRIVEYRDQHGGFRSVADLRHVSGIGDARYAELRDLVTV